MKSPHMPTIIIVSLPDAVERRERMRQQMRELGLPFRFFDAYRPETMPDNLRSYFFDDHGRPYSEILLPGEIGCYASHLGVMSLLAEGELEEPLLVLEDDANIREGAVERIARIAHAMRQQPDRIEHVNLYHSRFRCPQERLNLGSNLQLIQPFFPSVLTVGYITSRRAAQKFLKWKQQRILPVDIDIRLMALENLNYWESDPALVIPNGAMSTIDQAAGRKSKERKKKLKRIYSKKIAFATARHKYGMRAWMYCWILHKIIRKPWLWLFPSKP